MKWCGMTALRSGGRWAALLGVGFGDRLVEAVLARGLVEVLGEVVVDLAFAVCFLGVLFVDDLRLAGHLLEQCTVVRSRLGFRHW